VARYCANCGTEVDDSAVFCPTCGQPVEDVDPSDLPPAPAWPDPAASDLEDADDRAAAPETAEEHWDEPVADAPTRIEERPAPPSEPEIAPERPLAPPAPRESRGESREPGEPRDRERDPDRRPIDLPLTMPVTVSGWLIGIGSVLAAIGLVVILVVGVLNVLDLLLLLALLTVAATIFFAAHLPGMPHLRLVTLVVVLIAFGVALDRVGFRGGGIGELLFFLGTAAAAIGAIILEAGQDQPLGGPQR
jgi:hypothetical protein